MKNILKTWSSKNGSANPQAAAIPYLFKNVIKQALDDYNNICLIDLKSQLDQELLEEDCIDYVHQKCNLGSRFSNESSDGTRP